MFVFANKHNNCGGYPQNTLLIPTFIHSSPLPYYHNPLSPKINRPSYAQRGTTTKKAAFTRILLALSLLLRLFDPVFFCQCLKCVLHGKFNVFLRMNIDFVMGSFDRIKSINKIAKFMIFGILLNIGHGEYIIINPVHYRNAYAFFV